jgi:hypothetical protein
MFEYTLTYKNVPHYPTYAGQLMEHTGTIVSVAVDKVGLTIKINSSQELYSGALTQLDAIVPQDRPVQETVEDTIREAITFGQDLIIRFAAENVLLGITQAGMTTTVRNVTADAVSALSTGSLYDAIAAVRNIPAEDKDAVFVTDTRMLAFINSIETYLGLPNSTEL